MHLLAKVGSTRCNRRLRLDARARRRSTACPPRSERAIRPLAAGKPSRLGCPLPRPLAWAARPLAGSEPPAVRARSLSALPWLTALPEDNKGNTVRAMRRQPFFALALRRSAAPRHQAWLGAGYRPRREALSVVAAEDAALSGHQRPNHSIERTPSGLRPTVAAHVKR